MDCVLISSVFWRSSTLSRYLAQYLVLSSGGGGVGYVPTPMLRTLMFSRAAPSGPTASARA
jgi:hypothetical protein